MGLKKTNHTIEKLGLTIPEAYASIRNLYINGEHGAAEFAVQTSRDHSFNKQPLEVITVEFPVKRDENPYQTAYNYAKSEEFVTRGDKTIRYMRPFFGWQDDIH